MGDGSVVQKQHVDIQRKLKLRQTLLEKLGDPPGAYYIPFIGEGDIAVELYREKKIYGADIEPTMVETARVRLPDSEIKVADCDAYPFDKNTDPIILADFDSYSYPYDSFRSFWKGAKIGSQCAVIFTDGQKQAIIRSGNYRTPDGTKVKARTKTAKREAYDFYFNKTVLPWFKDYIKPWTILYITKYLSAGSMCYWGAIIAKPKNNNHKSHNSDKGDKSGSSHRNKFDSIKKEKYLEYIRGGQTRGYAATLAGIHRATVSIHMKKDKDFADAVSEAESDAVGKVEHALFEAATSGNVTAIQVFLYNRDPKRWSDKRNIQLAGEGGGPIKVEVDGKGKLISAINRLAARAGEAEDTQEPDGI